MTTPAASVDTLVTAVVQGDMDTLEACVTPANVNATDATHRLSLLLWALTAEDPAAVALLLERGASLLLHDANGFHALHRGVWCGNVALVELLLYDRAPPERGGGRRWRPGAQRLLHHPHEATGRTPLLLAVVRGDLAMVRLLLASGADASQRDRDGFDAADLAALCGWLHLVQYLQAVAALGAGASLSGRPLEERLQYHAEQYSETAKTLEQKRMLDDINRLICSSVAPQSRVAAQ
ncbi:ankyrin [Strigomonas culicis]|uniref:Ankyrin n=1 Tax=Strigomonas culicis TaxID=28005 RepID=S9UGK0_9TRYP|nr:ankyrin [Strigomonas culicis]|eukprot:EPY27879.1 ankyrin [Strigomonas culicis]